MPHFTNTSNKWELTYQYLQHEHIHGHHQLTFVIRHQDPLVQQPNEKLCDEVVQSAFFHSSCKLECLRKRRSKSDSKSTPKIWPQSPKLSTRTCIRSVLSTYLQELEEAPARPKLKVVVTCQPCVSNISTNHEK